MKTSDDSLDRIKAEVLINMPHVAKAINFRSLDYTWKRLSQVDNGAYLLEQQLTINDIMRDMVHEDINRTRSVYESRMNTVDSPEINPQEVVLALQSIQDYETRAMLVITNRQNAIRQAIEMAQSPERIPLAFDMPHVGMYPPEYHQSFAA